MPQAVKVRADIEVGCCAYDGIDAVKAALKKGMTCSTADNQIKINLIAPPSYVVTTQTLDREEGLRLLNLALEKIKESILAAGGIFNVQQAVISLIAFNCRTSLSLAPLGAPSWLVC